MHKLVILAQYNLHIEVQHKELIIAEAFETSARAEDRAVRWLEYLPNDIMMLVEVQTSTCKHCDLPVEEKIGGVLHLWAHEGGAMACLPDGATQATPKEAT